MSVPPEFVFTSSTGTRLPLFAKEDDQPLERALGAVYERETLPIFAHGVMPVIGTLASNLS